MPVIELLYTFDLDENEVRMVDNFKCIMHIEEQIISGVIEINVEARIDELLAACTELEFRVANSGRFMLTKQTVNSQLTVIPNPAYSNLTISANIEYFTAKITNPIGQTLFSDKINYTKTIDVSSFFKGIYFLTIEK